MKKTLLVFSSLFIGFSSMAQDVNIPDAKFFAKLKALNYDKNFDNKFQVTELNKVTSLALGKLSIADLTGIEAFAALTILECHENLLTSLDVSKNIALKKLTCQNNKITFLDLSKNTALTTLDCSTNNLTSLSLSTNTALTDLYTFSNPILNLDVSKNTLVSTLQCSGNQLSSLDVSKNTALKVLNCSENSISTLDLSANTALVNLGCSFNKLSSLNLNTNKNVEYVIANSNKLTSLDVSNNLVLSILYTNNNLTLTCIKALNTQNKASWQKDASTSYSETCLTNSNEMNIESTKTISKIYSIQGQEVVEGYKGLVIITFTDGSSKKMIQ